MWYKSKQCFLIEWQIICMLATCSLLIVSARMHFYVNCCCYRGSNDDPNAHAHSPSLVRGMLLCPGPSHTSNKVTEHNFIIIAELHVYLDHYITCLYAVL